MVTGLRPTRSLSQPANVLPRMANAPAPNVSTPTPPGVQPCTSCRYFGPNRLADASATDTMNNTPATASSRPGYMRSRCTTGCQTGTAGPVRSCWPVKRVVSGRPRRR